MESNQTTHRWSDIYKMNVTVPEMGKSFGQVEDFYFQEGTNAIYALSVRTRLHGDLALPITGIVAIGKDHVAMRNQQMLTKAIPPFTRGQKLLTRKVLGENGTEVGNVKDLLLGIEPPFTMWVVGFDIAHGSKSHTFSADGIAAYDDEANTLIIRDQVAKKLR
jgi:sporulation protein YlmC with PRC-barrel domain